MKDHYGEVLGSSGKVTIGNNCFIGMNSVILKGTQIGDNVIVGAGSIVTGGTYPSNCVIAGNPARVICTLEKYKEKREKAQLQEAVELFKEYYKVYHKVPSKDVLAEFFWLFEPREELTNESFISQMNCVDNFNDSMEVFLKSKPLFGSYEEFARFCLTR